MHCTDFESALLKVVLFRAFRFARYSADMGYSSFIYFFFFFFGVSETPHGVRVNVY